MAPAHMHLSKAVRSQKRAWADRQTDRQTTRRLVATYAEQVHRDVLEITHTFDAMTLHPVGFVCGH